LFHETKEEKNMFKKTLLAVSIAAIASTTANAGQLVAGVTETAQLVTDNQSLVSTTCVSAAAALGVTLTGSTIDAAAIVGSVVAGAGVTAGIYDQGANTVAEGTTTSTCVVTYNSDLILTASDVASSIEGAQAAGTTVDAVYISGVGGLNDEDTIKFSFTGGTVNEFDSAGATLVSKVTSTADAYKILGVDGNDLLFIGNSTALPAVGFTMFDLAGVSVTPDSGVTELDISSATTSTTGVNFDNSPATTVTALKSQFKASVDYSFDGVIDVTENRVQFEVNANDSAGSAELVNTDSAKVLVSTETTQGNLPVNEINFTLAGNFDWLAEYVLSTSTTAAAISTDLSAVLIYAGSDSSTLKAGTMALNGDNSELSFTATVTNTSGPAAIAQIDPEHTFTVTLPAAEADRTATLFKTDFEVSVEAVDTTEVYTATVATDVMVGEWTLNGSVVTIPYMPFDDNTAAILRHTNTGSQSGGISIRYMLEGESTDWVAIDGEVATSTRGVMNIRDAVINAIKADSGEDSGKVAIEITTNVPKEQVTVYAAFKVRDEQDRGFVGTFGAQGSAQNSIQTIDTSAP
jgi:hypothetical protein